jgi:O-antigen ligase
MHQQHDKLVTFSAVLIAAFLNQANTVMGINFSFSDVLCLFLTMYLVLKSQFKLLRLPTVYFILLVVFTLFTSFIYVPAYFMYQPGVSSVIVNSIKLLVTFIYFTVGYSLSFLGLDEYIAKWYSVTAFCMGFVGVLFTIFQTSLFSDILFFGGSRLRGLMNDPNYFSIVQISALVYFTRKTDSKRSIRFGILLVLLFSILASGSKTGMITLISYLLFRMIETLFQRKIQIGSLISVVLIMTSSVLVLLNLSTVTEKAVQYLSSLIPSFDRIYLVFTDFSTAVSGMGSERDTTWKVALNLIQQSPVFGIGIGTYAELAKQLYGTSNIAHNTYLQLFSEWGILLASIVFLYIFYMIGNVTFRKNEYSAMTLTIRDILIVFLIGSLSISLNNARMFWIFLGLLASNIIRIREVPENACKGINYHGNLQLRENIR